LDAGKHEDAASPCHLATAQAPMNSLLLSKFGTAGWKIPLPFDILLEFTEGF
jgi:hypothetical protein